jgi:transcription elongation factor GreA
MFSNIVMKINLGGYIMAQEFRLTKEGYEEIVAEHENLVAVRRAEVAQKLKEAIAQGDLSENADYDAAKNEQAELEERILKLENMIRKATIINEADMTSDTVKVGLTVKVLDVEYGDEMEYTIVGSTEADPFGGKLSNESELGKNLLGKKVGDEVEIVVPDGFLKYRVLDITK